MATGKTVEELRVIYGLENDFSPEEEEEMRIRFEWVEQWKKNDCFPIKYLRYIRHVFFFISICILTICNTRPKHTKSLLFL